MSLQDTMKELAARLDRSLPFSGMGRTVRQHPEARRIKHLMRTGRVTRREGRAQLRALPKVWLSKSAGIETIEVGNERRD